MKNSEGITAYHCYDEIHKQYVELKKTLNYIEDNRTQIKKFFEENQGDIVFIACGSSYWMSLSAKSTMKLKSKRNTFAVKAGDIVLNEDEYIGMFRNPVFICPSRSGSTGEVLQAIDILKKQYPGAKIFSLIEYENSELEKVSDMCLLLQWANEVAVCQTRSFSSLYLSCILIADIVAGETVLFEQAEKYIEAAPSLYERDEPILKEIIEKNDIKTLVSLGSGVQYGVCIEGAYIVIEVAEFASNYFQLFEYRHGPIVLTDQNTAVFIVSSKKSREYEDKIIHEIKKYTDMVYVVSDKASPHAQHTFTLEQDFSDEIVALHFIFCMQSVSYRVAVKHGKNPDEPGDLVPFIQL